MQFQRFARRWLFVVSPICLSVGSTVSHADLVDDEESCEVSSGLATQNPDYYLIQDQKPQVLIRSGRPPSRGIEAAVGEDHDFHLEGKKYGYTAIGTLDLEFLRGIYFKAENSLFRELLYQFFLRNLFSGALGRIDGLDRPSWLTGKQVAYVFHAQHGNDVEVHWAIDGARFKKFGHLLPPRIRDLAGRYFRMGYQHYKKRLKINSIHNRRLWNISRQLMNRTILILKTKQSFMHIGSLSEARERARFKSFDIEGGLAIVWSRADYELLPMEIFNREAVPRNSDFTGEVTRFVVRKGAVADLGSKELQAATTVLVGLGVREVKVLADEARRKLFMPHGLKEQYERVATYEDKPEFVLRADPIDCVEAQQGPLLGALYSFSAQDKMRSLMTALWSAIYSR